MIRRDYHTHTTFCDGKCTAEEMVCAAISFGMDEIGFSGQKCRDRFFSDEFNQNTGKEGDRKDEPDRLEGVFQRGF